MQHQKTIGSLVMAAVVAAAVSCERVGSDATMTQSARASEFPDSWYFFGNNDNLAQLRQLVGTKAPPLTVSDWVGEPQDLRRLGGKVVVVEFWGTWCKPCMLAVPKNVQLVKDFQEQGLVFIGVHSTNDGSKMAAAAEQKGINYPVAVDVEGKSASAYRVSFWPTYVLIDRQGIVRAAGLEPGSVGKAVEVLLNET